MKNKVKLFEKLYLAEDGIEDIPPIQKLIDKGDWDGALEYAKSLNANWRIATITMKEPLDQNQLQVLNDTCKRNKLDVKYFDSSGKNTVEQSQATVIKLSGTDEDSSSKLASVIDLLDENKVFPPDRDSKYDQLSNNDAQTEVIDKFNEKEDIKRKVRDNAQPILRKLMSELGLNDYDNPFIDYIRNWNGESITKEALIALNNLYADYTIDEDWLIYGKDKMHNILLNPTIFRSLPRTNEVMDVIHRYADFDKMSSNDPNWAHNRDNNFIDSKTGTVYNYQTIMDNLKKIKLAPNYNHTPNGKSNNTIVVKDDDINRNNIDISMLSREAKNKLINKLSEE